MSSLSTSHLKPLDPIFGRQFGEIKTYTDNFIGHISRQNRTNFAFDHFYVSIIKLFGFEVDANFIYHKFLSTMKLAIDSFTDENLESRMKIFKIKRISDRTHIFYSVRNDVENNDNISEIIRTDVELYELFLRKFYIVFYNEGNEDEDIYLTLKTRYIIEEDVFDADIYKNMTSREIKGRRSSRVQRRVRKVRREIDYSEYKIPTQLEMQNVLKDLLNLNVRIPDMGKIINFFIGLIYDVDVTFEEYFFLTFVKLISKIISDSAIMDTILDDDILNIINIVSKASHVLEGNLTQKEKDIYKTMFNEFSKIKQMVVDEKITEENFRELYGFLIPLFEVNSFEDFLEHFILFDELKLSNEDKVSVMYDYLTEVYYNINSDRKDKYNRDYISNIFLPKSAKGRRKEYVGNRGEALVRGYSDNTIDIPIYYYLDIIYNLLPLNYINSISTISSDVDSDIQYISESYCRVCGNFVGKGKTFLRLMERKNFTQNEASIVLDIDKRCCINTIIDRTIISRINPYSTMKFKSRIIDMNDDIDNSIKRSIRSIDDRLKVMKYIEEITLEDNQNMIPGETIIIGDETYYVEKLVHVGSGFVTPKISKLH